MPQQTITRDYPFADGDLKQKADGLADSLTRDLADLAVRKILAGNVTSLQGLISSFDEHSTDQELLGLVQDATDKKNAKRKEGEIAIRSIRNMAEIAYNGRGKYLNFGFEEITKISDADFYRLAKRVGRIANKYLTDLAPQGLNAAQVTAIKTIATDFDNAIDDIEDAVENRDVETQERIKKGNALYAEMMKLASVGKSIYEDVNEAKFNDYVLTPSENQGDTPIVTPTP